MPTNLTPPLIPKLTYRDSYQRILDRIANDYGLPDDIKINMFPKPQTNVKLLDLLLEVNQNE